MPLIPYPSHTSTVSHKNRKAHPAEKQGFKQYLNLHDTTFFPPKASHAGVSPMPYFCKK